MSISAKIKIKWIKLLGPTRNDTSASVSVANDGFIYLTGTTEGDFEGLDNKVWSDAYITRLDHNGAIKYSQLYGTYSSLMKSSSFASANHITTALDSSFYIAGYSSDEIQGIKFSGINAFLSKYNSSGAKEWSTIISSAGDKWDEINSITIADDGFIYVAGWSEGSIDGQTNRGMRDAFISKHSPDGTKVWTKLFGTASWDYAKSITIGSDQSIYVTGYTGGDLDGQSNKGGSDAFIAKYKSDGAIEWTRLLGSSSDDNANSITNGGDGFIYIAGYTRGDLGEGHTNTGVSVAFIAKYKNDGTREWTKVLDTQGSSVANSISTGSDGSVFITGVTSRISDSGYLAGDWDAFIAKYSKEGEKEWIQVLSTPSTDWGASINVTSSGEIYIAGKTDGNLGGESNTGESNAFVAKLIYDVGVATAGTVTGNGAFQEGVTLSAPVVTGDPDGDATNPNYAYQWFKGSTAITNATASTYAVPASGAGTYKVAVTYTDAQGFTATLDSPEQVVSKQTLQQVDIAPSQRGSLFRVESDAAPELIVNLKGSPDLIEINAEVSATLNAVTTENWSTGYVAWNVGSTIQAGTEERVFLNGLGKYSFVATAINAATSTIVLEQDKNSAFFLHDAYSAFYEGLTLTTDSTGRQSAARILDFDVIKMGSAGGNSIVDLTSKDYVTGAVTVHGADKGRSIFWGTDSDDTFLSGGGDSVIFGGGGFNQSILGTGKDVLQFRSTVDSTNLIQGFDPAKDVLELWRGRTETVEAPTFITDGNSTTMTWGSNTVQFEGLTGNTAESLLTSTRFAV